MIAPALYDSARDRIAAEGLTADVQSKVSLILCAAKNANLLFQNQAQWFPPLGILQPFFASQIFRESEMVTNNANLLFQNQAQWLPALGVAQQFFISQAFRESEMVTLLTRTTLWTPDISLFIQAQSIVFPLLSAWEEVMRFPGPLYDTRAFFRGVSLGHAQLARIRMTPILPDNLDPLAPYAIALQRIEQENGRMLQTQIRLLKSVGAELPLEEREALIEKDQEIVDGVFNAFLAWLNTERKPLPGQGISSPSSASG